MGATAFALQRGMKTLYALAIALCPAAMVGLHFSLAEPLSLLLLTVFLIRYSRSKRLQPLDLLLLALIGLTREIHLLLLLAVCGYSMLRQRWSDALKSLIPLTVFLSWHSVIYGIFQEIPFLTSTDKRDVPFKAIADILMGRDGFTLYTLSSIALFLLFVLPAMVWLLRDVFMTRTKAFLPWAALGFLGVMLLMPDHIWGSITSIGRVITPVYPLVIISAAHRDTLATKALMVAMIFLGIGTALGLATIIHPFTLS